MVLLLTLCRSHSRVGLAGLGGEGERDRERSLLLDRLRLRRDFWRDDRELECLRPPSGRVSLSLLLSLDRLRLDLFELESLLVWLCFRLLDDGEGLRDLDLDLDKLVLRLLLLLSLLLDPFRDDLERWRSSSLYSSSLKPDSE